MGYIVCAPSYIAGRILLNIVPYAQLGRRLSNWCHVRNQAVGCYAEYVCDVASRTGRSPRINEVIEHKDETIPWHHSAVATPNYEARVRSSA